jgi:hypothetical protein
MKYPNAKYLIPKHDWPDYKLKAGLKYKIRYNEGGGGRFIRPIEPWYSLKKNDPTYLDNGEVTEELWNDFEVIE